MKWVCSILASWTFFLGSVTCTPYDCDPSCMLSIVESIPENLVYPSGSPSHCSTYDAWMNLLANAKETVDIASYYWTLRGFGNIQDVTDKQGRDVFDALSNLTSRGVTLRIVQNPPNKEFPNMDTQTMQEMGVASVQNLDITSLIGNGILHTKLWVVDSKHFYVGSANMDWRSLTQVKEMGLLGMNCECLTQDAQKLFDVYWYLSTPGNSIPSGGKYPESFTALFNLSNPAKLTVNESLQSAVFWASSPPPFCTSGRTNDIDALLHVINTAETFVYVAVMDYAPAVVFVREKYYWARIDDALRTAAFRGVTVRLMGSYWNHTHSDMIRFLKSLSDDNGMGYHATIETKFFSVPPLTTKNIPYTRVNHNKYMVTDNAAYIGTSNWSGDYFINTGGLSCTLSSLESSGPKTFGTPIQQQLKDVFERDWFSQYTVNMAYFKGL